MVWIFLGPVPPLLTYKIFGVFGSGCGRAGERGSSFVFFSRALACLPWSQWWKTVLGAVNISFRRLQVPGYASGVFS